MAGVAIIMSLLIDLQIEIDETAGPTFYVIDQVYDALNQAQLEVWSNLKQWQLTSATMAIAPGTAITTLPLTSVMIPQYVIYVTQGVKIFPTTYAMLQDWQSGWMNEPPARPNWMVLWDAEHLRWFPPPDITYNFVLYGTPWPTEVTAATIDAGTDPLTADPLVGQAIVKRAAAILLEDSQPVLADLKIQEAMDYETRYARQQRNAQGANTLRLRPGVAWDVAQQGDINVGRKFSGQGVP